MHPEPAPDALADRYGSVCRSENTFEVESAGLESARARADRGWGVGALVTHEGRVLLVQQEDRWLLPGGMLEAGETPATGAIRETREETGIEIAVTGLAAIAEQTFTDGRETFVFHFAVFDATPETTDLATEPGIDGEAIHDVAWHDSLPENTFDREFYTRLLGRESKR